ncbi:MAG: hypothetical protein FH761_19200 [Firmicutes bacterium]|nr:hypothetical protein [Bacillota bacterium]
MNSKKLKILLYVFMIIILLTSCSSGYEKDVKKFRKIYNNTLTSLDSDNAYNSIKNDDLTSNIEKLKGILIKIEKGASKNNNDELIALRTKYEMIKEIVEKGSHWDLLKNTDKFMIKNEINILKNKN